MNNRAYGFAALLAVIGLSIVFGMALGARLSAPQFALAAPGEALRGSMWPILLAPAATSAGMQDFADIAERSVPAVVGVTNTQLISSSDEDARERFRDEPFFRWFFGDPDDPDRPREIPQIGRGSGFIVSPKGYILTNHHVVEDAKRIMVSLSNGDEVEAEVIGADPAIDLAVIKIDAKGRQLPVLPLGDSDSLRVGEWVLAIGSPLEFENTVTVGVVSAKERRVPIGKTDTAVVHFIQTDAAINFGNSGGPLLDAAGNVIGISTAIRRGNLAEGIGFALPINEARRAMEELLTLGKVQRGFLGIEMNPQGINEASAEYYGLPDTQGVIVARVTDGEPADTAGIERNDVIRRVDGEVVRDNFDLVKKISSHRPGDEIEIEIFRDGRTISRTATLIEREPALVARRGGGRDDSDVQPPEEPEEAKGLGITVENLSRSARARLEIDSDLEGVLVADVDFDSAAASQGVFPQSVITSVNDQPVGNVSAWERIIGDLRPGKPVKIELFDPRFGGQDRLVFIRAPEQ